MWRERERERMKRGLRRIKTEIVRDKKLSPGWVICVARTQCLTVICMYIVRSGSYLGFRRPGAMFLIPSLLRDGGC